MSPFDKITATAPDHIWLDLGEEAHLVDDGTTFRDLGGVTWSEDNATGQGIKYVRALASHTGEAEPVGWQVRWNVDGRGFTAWTETPEWKIKERIAEFPAGTFEHRPLYATPPAATPAAPGEVTDALSEAIILAGRHGVPVRGFGEESEMRYFAEKLAALIADVRSPQWRCFHCDECFTTADSAMEHFGRTERQSPACQIDIAEYRAMEQRMLAYTQEDADIHREMHARLSDHQLALVREEERGYSRGLADAKKHPAELGLVAALSNPAPVPTFKRWKISDKFRVMQQHPEGHYYDKDEVDACLVAPAPASGAVAEVLSWTNSSYSRNYKLRWLRDVPEGTKLYATPSTGDSADAPVQQAGRLGALLQDIDYAAHHGWPAESLERIKRKAAALKVEQPVEPSDGAGAQNA